MRRFMGLGGSSSSSRSGPISGNNASDKHRAEDVITIKHGPSEYLFKYPVNTIASHALNVGHVRDKASEITGVDVKRLTLICAGKKLTNNDATLQTLGIEHGAKLLAMGTNVAPPRNPAATNAALKQSPAPKPKAVLGPAAKIEAVRDHVVSTLLPLVEEFLAGKGADKRSDMHRRLGETIMAELLKLDGIETEDPQIRSRRKEVVREIQGYLDSLDKSLRESK